MHSPCIHRFSLGKQSSSLAVAYYRVGGLSWTIYEDYLTMDHRLIGYSYLVFLFHTHYFEHQVIIRSLLARMCVYLMSVFIRTFDCQQYFDNSYVADEFYTQY
jgi:hypothetical protein